MVHKQIQVIDCDDITVIHSMLEKLEEKINTIETKVTNVNNYQQANEEIFVAAPSNFEISMLFLAKALGISKSTIGRRIDSNILPEPKKNKFNGYKYWLKKDLPEELHAKIDERYTMIHGTSITKKLARLSNQPISASF